MLRTAVLDPVEHFYIVYHLYATLPHPALPFPSHGAGSVSGASVVVLTWFLLDPEAPPPCPTVGYCRTCIPVLCISWHTYYDGLIYTKKMITCIYHVFVSFHSVHNTQYKQQSISVTSTSIEKGQKTLV